MDFREAYTLTLDIKDAFKHKIEDFKDLDSSPLSGVFREGLILAKKVILNTESSQAHKGHYFPGSDLNNILAFVGDRGSGKTSALLSFTKLLEESTNNNIDLNAIIVNEDSQESFRWPSFFPLEHLEPSALEGSQRIVEVIIARLYKCFLDLIELEPKNSSGINDINIKEAMSAFNNIMRALRIIRHPDLILRENFAGKDMMLEKLEELGTISGLKKEIEILIHCILCLKFQGNVTGSFLILTLDDVDLHLDNPMQVLEDLRKYFRVPRLLILTGLRFDQLHSKISIAYEREARGANNEIFDDPRNLADAYLRKLIPEDARLLMPFTNLRSKSLTCKVVVCGYFGSKNMAFNSLFSALQYLIRKKIGITISDRAYPNGHPFLPNSLREAHDIFSELARWRDIPKSKDELKDFENFEKFKNFLIRSWAIGKVPREIQIHLDEITSVNAQYIAKLIILKAPIAIERCLAIQRQQEKIEASTVFDPDIYPKLRILDPNWFPNSSYEEIKPMFSPRTNPNNIGIGEVAVLMKILDGHYQNFMVTTSVFLIRMIYSIRILQEVFQQQQSEAWRNLVGASLMPSEVLRQGYDPFARIFLSSFAFKGLASKLESSDFDPLNTEWMEAYQVFQSFLVFTPPYQKNNSRPYRENHELALFPDDIDEKDDEQSPNETALIPNQVARLRPKANRTIDQGFFNLSTFFAKAGYNAANPNVVHPRPFTGLLTTIENPKDATFSTQVAKWHQENLPIWPIWNIEFLIEDSNVRAGAPNSLKRPNRQMFGAKESLFVFIDGFFKMHSLLTSHWDGNISHRLHDALSYSEDKLASHPIFNLFSLGSAQKFFGVKQKLQLLFNWLYELAQFGAQKEVRKEIGLEYSNELGRLINSRSQDPRYLNLFRSAIRSLENSTLINRRDTSVLIERLKEIQRAFEERTAGGQKKLHVNERRSFGRQFKSVLDQIEGLISPR